MPWSCFGTADEQSHILLRGRAVVPMRSSRRVTRRLANLSTSTVISDGRMAFGNLLHQSARP
jgi:hypothetical protein